METATVPHMEELKRPAGLGDDEWSSIQEVGDRLVRAKAALDEPLIVGTAKEMCEAIAKVVIGERGGMPGSSADMSELITTAHRLLDYQPGEGLANDPEIRRVAQGLKSIVLGVGEMRNRHGTGHGRAAPSGITEEHGELAYQAALLWSGWALRRLEPYIAGDVTALVRDLEGEIFHAGDLSRRLTLANLPRLADDEQVRLGIAVARRASRGTFVVSGEGITAVDPGDPGNWPTGYIAGLVAGLFFDPNGNVDLTAWKVNEAGRLIAGLHESASFLHRLIERLTTSAATYGGASDEDVRRETIQQFEKTAPLLPEGEPRRLWLETARLLHEHDGDGD
jgi:hypothetical protein